MSILLALSLGAVAGAALEPDATDQAPVPISDSLRGAQLYARMCAVCHGPSGEGYKADNAPALNDPGFLGSVTDEYLRRAVADGRAGTTMSAWAAERGGPLAKNEIGEVVAYIRAWAEGPRIELDERPLAGSARRGEGLFAAHCASCHGGGGLGGKAAHIGNPALLRDASDGFLRYAVRSGRGKDAMPPFQETLGDQGIEDVVAWLRLLQSTSPVPVPPYASPAPVPRGAVLLNSDGGEPVGFNIFPKMTSADVIKAQLDLGAKMTFLDARPSSDYLVEHIAGAISVPFYEPGPHLPFLPRDAWLVCYCGCPHAESGQLAQRLLSAGFKKVTVLDEGLRYWQTKKYGVRRGPDP